MRLTLRTLLAYLDDALTPEQTRVIGEKVAESELAQGLIEKLRKVTRKRTLPTPPPQGEDAATDPNTIAEYLDNALDAEQVEALEKTALESDPHLAEIAACHQILTLVLGEPMPVPPTAHQRMYKLVRGRESIPYRKPSGRSAVGVSAPAAADPALAEDEELLLGLPAYSRTQSLSRNLVPVLGVLALIAALVGAILLLLPGTTTLPADPSRAAVVWTLQPAPPREAPKELPRPTEEAAKPPTPAPVPMPDPVPVPPDEGAKMPEELAVLPREPQAEAPPKKEPLIIPVEKPDPERRFIGTLENRDAILLARPEGERNWTRVFMGSPQIRSTEQLVSLPHSRAELQLDRGVRLTLWGNLPEFINLPLLESRVVLYHPAAECEADFRLQAGRVFVANRKQPPGPVRVRVRFLKETWDVTLPDARSEVAIDLFGIYPPGAPFSKEPDAEPPQATCSLAVLAGGAKVVINNGQRTLENLQAPTQLVWQSKPAALFPPIPLDARALDAWRRTPPKSTPQTQQMDDAFRAMAQQLTSDTNVEVSIGSNLRAANERPAELVYSVQCLQAIDSVGYLADALAHERPDVRTAAIFAAKHWTGNAPERDLLLHAELVKKKGYAEAQADLLLQLLHGYGPDRRDDPGAVESLFEFLGHEQLAVRELAHFWLAGFFDPAGARELKGFDAAAPAAAREAAVKRWRASWVKRSAAEKDKKK